MTIKLLVRYERKTFRSSNFRFLGGKTFSARNVSISRDIFRRGNKKKTKLCGKFLRQFAIDRYQQLATKDEAKYHRILDFEKIRSETRNSEEQNPCKISKRKVATTHYWYLAKCLYSAPRCAYSFSSLSSYPLSPPPPLNSSFSSSSSFLS